MMKYKLTGEEKLWGCTSLHRIQALRDIPRHGVKAGDLGGWIEGVRNLSQFGDCWVADDAKVFGHRARVEDDALISDVAQVTTCATVESDAQIYGCAGICGYAMIGTNAKISAHDHWITTILGHGFDPFATFYRAEKDGQVYIQVRTSHFRGSLDSYDEYARGSYGGRARDKVHFHKSQMVRHWINLKDEWSDLYATPR